jgi:hypothetical protein
MMFASGSIDVPVVEGLTKKMAEFPSDWPVLLK